MYHVSVISNVEKECRSVWEARIVCVVDFQKLNCQSFKPPNIIVPSHPLDPLTPDEILLASKICKQLRPGNVFVSVCILEFLATFLLTSSAVRATERRSLGVLPWGRF